MAIPKYDEMYREFLEALADGRPHKIREIRDRLAELFGVTEEERKVLLPSGKQPLFNNRVAWTSSYLKQAQLIETLSRGTYIITEQGKNVFQNGPKIIENDYLLKFKSFQSFVAGNGFDKKNNTKAERNELISENQVERKIESINSVLSGQTPQDILDDAYGKINDTLVEEVLSEVMKQTPRFFEHLVVKLMTAIGYGGSLEGAGIVTQASVDGGIDGIIREDKLGFNKIYIQAKRWDRNNTVGAPEIQRFFGALAAKHAKKGLFITTSKFSDKAKEFAEQQQIVLVDGKALAKLMIEYNVGVSIEATYYIKKIDSDFFDDDLN